MRDNCNETNIRACAAQFFTTFSPYAMVRKCVMYVNCLTWVKTCYSSSVPCARLTIAFHVTIEAVTGVTGI